MPALARSFQGKVTRFSVDVTNATRTMHTEVDIPNTSKSLVPGLYAEAVLSLNDKASVIAVPLQAINHEGNRSSVLLVNDSHRIEDRPITVGLQTANYVEVIKGVQPGEQVVVSHRSGLNEGQTVSPQAVAPMVYATNAKDTSAQE